MRNSIGRLVLSKSIATEEQTERILKRYLNNPFRLRTVSCSFDEEDSIYFIEVEFLSFIKATTAEWQVRENNLPCFFSFTKGYKRYDVPYPDKHLPALHEKLKVTSKKAIRDFLRGNEI
jgi:hypothetical protein